MNTEQNTNTEVLNSITSELAEEHDHLDWNDILEMVIQTWEEFGSPELDTDEQYDRLSGEVDSIIINL